MTHKHAHTTAAPSQPSNDRFKEKKPGSQRKREEEGGHFNEVDNAIKGHPFSLHMLALKL